ncbi:MAG TPA: DUF4956 domain-containing protein [Desulfitobacteriaceae bacterium]|nr:DUF4956 domain-containing protein [Desulfitobacteriaceae bacterium]
MTFDNIFKSSFLEMTASFSPLDMVLALGLALVTGLFIYLIYRKTFSGVMYSSGFGVSLIAMSLITTFIILAISSNVVLSLGMVGALSIVRFRTAVKEPMDIAFLFWAIAAGIVIGSGMILLAVCGSVFIGIILTLFANKKSTDNPFILIIDCENQEAEKRVLDTVSRSVKKHMVKSKTVSAKGIELTMEVRLKEMSTDFINQLAASTGVHNAVLVSYNGDYQT